MGTKRPSCTLFDTVSNINMSDRKLQPGGKISRDPSPRPAKTAQSERDRDGKREDDRRRETEMEKMRDKARYKDVDPRERYYERTPVSRMREEEKEWRERERRQGDDSSRNGRPLSNLERDPKREVGKGKKGDTFPRMRKSSEERDRRTMCTTKIDEKKGESRQRRMEADDWEREKMKTWQREQYRERERDEKQSRAKDEGRKSGGRPVDDDKLRQRERYEGKISDADFQDRGREVGDSRDRREKDAARRREKPRPYMGEKQVRLRSPDKRRDREIHSNRKEREGTPRREGKRDTKSEGDSDERELKREKVRGREREELIYQHSRSEGDSKGKRPKEKDPNRQGYREDDRQRDRDREREGDRSRRKAGEEDRERYKEVDRRAAKEGEKWRESGRDLKEDRARPNDRIEDDRYKQTRDRERKERESERRWDDTAGRSKSKVPPRVPPRSQSSGEWSSDMDSEVRYRRGRDSNEEKESGRERTAERKRDVEEPRDPERAAERRQRDQKGGERQERERGDGTGSLPEQRRMWLEPQSGKNTKEVFVDRERHTRKREEEKIVVSRAAREREMQQVKEEPDERDQDQSSYRERHAGRDMEREAEGASVDGEEVWRETDKVRKQYLSDSSGGIEGGWERDAENTTDNTEDSDREEEGRSDYFVRPKKGGEGESGRREERDSLLSVEDGFVTVSSGGDEEDEREEDEEEDFKDCHESWGGGIKYDGSPPVGFKGPEGDKERVGEWTIGKEEAGDEEEQGREKQSKYVSQTLPKSKPGDMSLSQFDEMGVDNPNLERCPHHSDDITQQHQGDQHPTLSRKNEYPFPYYQDKEGNSEHDMTTEMEVRNRSSSGLQDSEAEEGMRSKVENPYEEIGQIKRDSQTEKLLGEWREKNKVPVERKSEQLSPTSPYGDVFPPANFEQIQPILDGIKTGAITPEEVEAIRIRMSGAWSMSEEPKRHSQAPHLKWAQNVVLEILGQSEEQLKDEPNPEKRGEVNQSEQDTQQEERGIPVVKMSTNEEYSTPELEGLPLEMEGLRGMGQSQADMHADQFTDMHGDSDTPTHTHADTLLDTEGEEGDNTGKETELTGHLQLEKADIDVTITQEECEEVVLSEAEKEERREKEVEMYLSVSNTLYKPSSCPILNYESESDPSREGESQEEVEREGESEEEREGGEPEDWGTAVEEGEMRVGEEMDGDSREGEAVAETQVRGTLTSSFSFQDMGPKARIRRMGIRKTTERRKGELVEEEEEEEGGGRDRRTRIFSASDDEDDRSKSMGEVELRNVLDTIDRRKRNSRFFNAAQLYQQYSEAAQNFEILSQARSDGPSVSEDNASSPALSPPPARRPLPPLPPVPHPHSLSHSASITSVKSLPLPEPPKSEGRPSSPRLSITLTQSSTLWRDLPGVRNSGQLDDLSEDQRRLQEVRFEVLTSEASYCRSLDIVVEHFVKAKQLGALLTTQDRNWLFSRLADVRAISHSFLSKLEERVETEIVHFTVCDIIVRHCQRFKMVYVPYLTNQSYQDATYQRLMNENQGFKRIVDKLERSPVCQRLPLRSFLVLPFQRITRIKLLVQNIVKRTTPGTAEATQAIKAMKLLEKLIQESNDSISQMKNIESLVTLSAKVDFECRTLPLISQSRRLVREGVVTELMDFSLKDTERNIHMHLFNDYLLISLHKEGGRFTVIDHSPVSELRAENCRVKLHSLQKNVFRLHMLHKSLLLRTDTQSDKLRWISALSRPHPEIDFSAAQDFPQMQCMRGFVGQQPDELSLEKAEVILVHQQSSDHWVEGTRLSDRHHGWVPESHLETITNSRVRQRNLSDALKLTTAKAAA
ncbi:trichohyalin isoform X1 [Hippoglossus hippoglossus]|uniref:trichohyalin isoform X1 n=1 Tax=Hippoglossus hippoglossus TaxID=8267 RepID=UPI00148CB5F7|nr:trichohyalin isoform X1 [Hippoglossus hippoglossus]